MNWMDLPWLEGAVLLPMIGALVVGRVRNSDSARSLALMFSGAAFFAAVVAWQQFADGGAEPANLLERMLGYRWLALDNLSAPLLPLAALLFVLTAIATLRTKIRRYSFAWNLLSETLVLAALASTHAWLTVALLSLHTLPPLVELRERRKPVRAYVLHMGLFIALMVLGQSLITAEGPREVHSLMAVLPLAVAIFIRCGVAPFHCWITDLFEHSSFGTALLFVTPMLGELAAVRLLIPIAPDSILRTMGWLSLVTAVYASGMALVQKEARRFFCYIFLSHSALVLVGLETVSSLGTTGALCVWLSAGLSLGGFGLTLRALEARHGRLSLNRYHGAYENTPILAINFFLTGMASVGFPGTFGFIGTEMLVDGVVTTYAYVGVAVVVAAAVNGIAVLQAYFVLFTGRRPATTVPLAVSGREWFAVLAILLLIIGGGLLPQPSVESRYIAAEKLLQKRKTLSSHDTLSHALTTPMAPVATVSSER